MTTPGIVEKMQNGSQIYLCLLACHTIAMKLHTCHSSDRVKMCPFKKKKNNKKIITRDYNFINTVQKLNEPISALS